MRFNGLELTEESIQKTRQLFADISLACIEEVECGKVRVNDPESYFAWRKEEAKEVMEGKADHTLTFLQRAYYVQTGESVALLP
ncbi:hypothetical protein [Paenibacillus xylanexedens]|uniref:hypothetical protein n=1 Tax=Paenibacillus xylanexedens TaxID=528191 RepID=UPI000F52EE96|nr:hypothetical protein [Paenibacillus xylanexedens]